MRIKGVQIRNHEMKILNFPDGSTIFLLINVHTRIQWILKSHEKACSSKTNFSKIKALWAGAHKNRIDKPGQMIWSQLYICTLKCLECILLILILIRTTGTYKWQIKTSNKKHDWTFVKYLNALDHNRTQKQLRH